MNDHRPWRVFGIGVGANLGDRSAQVTIALTLLEATPDVRRLLVAAPIRTEPVIPGNADVEQPGFLNTVILGETRWPPAVLMSRLLAVEAACGRRRRRWLAPRALDLDLLFLDGCSECRPGLELPHPRWRGRAFVETPLRTLLASDRVAESGFREPLERAFGGVRGPEASDP